MQLEPSAVDPKQIEQFAGHFNYPGSLFITVQVMAVADVSAAHQDAVSPFLERLQDEVGGDPPRTHHPDDPDIGRVLDTAYPGKIRACVCAPVAAKRDYFRVEICTHFIFLV